MSNRSARVMTTCVVRASCVLRSVGRSLEAAGRSEGRALRRGAVVRADEGAEAGARVASARDREVCVLATPLGPAGRIRGSVTASGHAHVLGDGARVHDASACMASSKSCSGSCACSIAVGFENDVESVGTRDDHVRRSSVVCAQIPWSITRSSRQVRGESPEAGRGGSRRRGSRGRGVGRVCA
jgi:hypothetical protein